MFRLTQFESLLLAKAHKDIFVEKQQDYQVLGQKMRQQGNGLLFLPHTPKASECRTLKCDFILCQTLGTPAW